MDFDILEMIDKHNLSIRRIPDSVTKMWTTSPNGDVRKSSNPNVTITAVRMSITDFHGDNPTLYQVKNWNKNYPDGYKVFSKEVTIPKHAGWYMCKSVNNSDSTVRWMMEKDNLAPTLRESIELFLSNID